MNRPQRLSGNKAVYNLVIIFISAFILSPLFVPHASPAEDPATIKIGGTGSALGTARKLAEEFKKDHPGVNVVIFPSMGSSGGIKAVLSGAIDIGLSSRPLSPEEKRRDAVEREYARTPFVVAASGKNPVSGFSLRELVDIYAGTKRSWPDGRQIRLVLRPSTDMDTLTLKQMSPAMGGAVDASLARQGIMTAVTDQDSADAIETIPGALGTSSLSLILSENRKLKALSVNGARPTPEALRNGSYPYFKRFYLVTRAHPSSAARMFVDFIRSARGRAVLVKTGHLAVTP